VEWFTDFLQKNLMPLAGFFLRPLWVLALPTHIFYENPCGTHPKTISVSPKKILGRQRRHCPPTHPLTQVLKNKKNLIPVSSNNLKLKTY
jgi:hypothetical protein